MTTAAIARNLRGRKQSSGRRSAPGARRSQPSLSLNGARDGRILVTCHAGRKQGVVIAALKARGLWPDRPARARRRIAATYDYTDEDAPMQATRFDSKRVVNVFG
jgi:hypothetical protein